MERRTSSKRHGLCAYRKHELLTGEISYPVLGYSGYGNGESTNLEDFISEEMLQDWREHRTELLKFWRSGEYTKDKPWLFVCVSAARFLGRSGCFNPIARGRLGSREPNARYLISSGRPCIAPASY
jgi:hypothetical protein